MKAMKIIAIVMVMLMLPLASSKAQFKTSANKQAFENSISAEHFEFRSTSTMACSGSNLPLAARNAYTVGADSPEDNSSSGWARGPRRIGGSGSSTGGNEAEESHDPQETPVGDGTWVMLVMAMGFAGVTLLRRRRVMQAKCISIE